MIFGNSSVLNDFSPIDKEEVTVAGTAIGITASKLVRDGSPVEKAFISTETESIRFWIDGSTPTSSSGHLAVAGSVIILSDRNQLINFRAIKITDNGALKITLYV